MWFPSMVTVLLPSFRWHQQKASQTWLVRSSLLLLRTISWACWQCVWWCCSSWDCCAAASPSVSQRSWRTGKESCQGREEGRPNLLPSSFPIPQKGGGEASSAPLCPSPTPGSLTMARWGGWARLKLCRFFATGSSHVGTSFYPLRSVHDFLTCGTPASSSASLWPDLPAVDIWAILCVRVCACTFRNTVCQHLWVISFLPFQLSPCAWSSCCFSVLHLEFMYLSLKLLLYSDVVVGFYVCLGFVVLVCSSLVYWGDEAETAGSHYYITEIILCGYGWLPYTSVTHGD